MAKIVVPKEQLEGYKTIPGGVYEVRLDGFDPQLSKDKKSVNLRPKLSVVNHPTLNDARTFDNLNTGSWYLHDFAHCFGLEMEDQGDQRGLPGEFQGPDNDPSKWAYIGPLLGRIGKVRTVIRTYNGKDSSNISQYYCALQGCSEKHSTELQGK